MNNKQHFLFDKGAKDFGQLNWPNDLESSILYKKLSVKTLFFPLLLSLNKPTYFFGSAHVDFLVNFPSTLQLFNPSYYSLEEYLKKVFVMGYYFPEIICDLKQYYPQFNISFSFEEYIYIDFGIQTIPVIDNILNHLLINDKPLTHVAYNTKDVFNTSKGLGTGNIFDNIEIKVPIKTDLNILEHLQEYYFGRDSICGFKDIINLYLDYRPDLKFKCINAGNDDINLGKTVTKDLPTYFICTFILKNISKDTQRFFVANLDLNNKKPLFAIKTFFIKEGENFSSEDRFFMLNSYKERLNSLKKKEYIYESKNILNDLLFYVYNYTFHFYLKFSFF